MVFMLGSPIFIGGGERKLERSWLRPRALPIGNEGFEVLPASVACNSPIDRRIHNWRAKRSIRFRLRRPRKSSVRGRVSQRFGEVVAAHHVFAVLAVLLTRLAFLVSSRHDE
jgi:hypothetical protein